MSRAIRTGLRDIGIELTAYWSGTFVGPQISKLMGKDAFATMLPILTVSEVHK